jgi:hypothetical protein
VAVRSGGADAWSRDPEDRSVWIVHIAPVGGTRSLSIHARPVPRFRSGVNDRGGLFLGFTVHCCAFRHTTVAFRLCRLESRTGSPP